MEWLKSVHMLCALLSFSGFFIRGIWMLSGSGLLNHKAVKIVPHLVDTLLLVTALLLLYKLQLSVLENSWLIAKIVALVVYILLGMMALRYAKSKFVKALCWMSGLVVFLYIVSVAMTKTPFGFTGLG